MNIYKKKKEYNSPEICRIELDNEISLVLASDLDPNGEPNGNGWGDNQHGKTADPFKNQLG